MESAHELHARKVQGLYEKALDRIAELEKEVRRVRLDALAQQGQDVARIAELEALLRRHMDTPDDTSLAFDTEFALGTRVNPAEEGVDTRANPSLIMSMTDALDTTALWGLRDVALHGHEGGCENDCMVCTDLIDEIPALIVEIVRLRKIEAFAREAVRHWPNEDGGLWAELDALKRTIHTRENENSHDHE